MRIRHMCPVVKEVWQPRTHVAPQMLQVKTGRLHLDQVKCNGSSCS